MIEIMIGMFLDLIQCKHHSSFMPKHCERRVRRMDMACLIACPICGFRSIGHTQRDCDLRMRLHMKSVHAYGCQIGTYAPRIVVDDRIPLNVNMEKVAGM